MASECAIFAPGQNGTPPNIIKYPEKTTGKKSEKNIKREKSPQDQKSRAFQGGVAGRVQRQLVFVRSLPVVRYAT
jgi:hypothetical protein